MSAISFYVIVVTHIAVVPHYIRGVSEIDRRADIDPCAVDGKKHDLSSVVDSVLDEISSVDMSSGGKRVEHSVGYEIYAGVSIIGVCRFLFYASHTAAVGRQDRVRH